MVTRNKSEHADGKTESRGDVRKLKSIFIFICFQFFILALLDAQFQFLIPNWINENYPVSSSQYFGYVGLLNGLAVLTLSPIIMKLSKTFSTQSNLGISAVFYGIGFLLIMVPHWFFIIVLSTLVWTIGEIMAANHFNTYVGTNAPSSIRGRLFSIPPLLLTLGKVVGAPIVALITTKYGYNFAWSSLAVLAGFGAVLSIIYILNERKRYETRNSPTAI